MLNVTVRGFTRGRQKGQGERGQGDNQRKDVATLWFKDEGRAREGMQAACGSWDSKDRHYHKGFLQEHTQTP